MTAPSPSYTEYHKSPPSDDNVFCTDTDHGTGEKNSDRDYSPVETQLRNELLSAMSAGDTDGVKAYMEELDKIGSSFDLLPVVSMLTGMCEKDYDIDEIESTISEFPRDSALEYREPILAYCCACAVSFSYITLDRLPYVQIDMFLMEYCKLLGPDEGKKTIDRFLALVPSRCGNFAGFILRPFGKWWLPAYYYGIDEMCDIPNNDNIGLGPKCNDYLRDLRSVYTADASELTKAHWLQNMDIRSKIINEILEEYTDTCNTSSEMLRRGHRKHIMHLLHELAYPDCITSNSIRVHMAPKLDENTHRHFFRKN